MTSVCLGNVPNGMYSDATMTTTTNYNFNCNQIIPWSGGAGDDKNQRLIVWGGGHSDYAGNEVSALNLNGTPAWQAITTPTIPIPYNGDGNSWEGLQPYFVRAADGGKYQAGASPSSRHTYNGVQYIPYQNKLYSFGGGVANAGNFSSETWTLDMGTAKWTLLGPPYSQAPNYPTSAYNPGTGHIVMHDKNMTLFDFDPNTGDWTTLVYGYHIDDGTTAAVDPVNNLFIVVGAAGPTDNLGYPSVPTSHTVQAFSLNPPYTMGVWSDPSCDLTYRSGGLAWDSILGLMVGYPGGGNQVYLLNTGAQDVVTPFGTVPSHKCLDVPISMHPSPVKGVDYPQDPEGTPIGANLGIYGRFAYFPSIDTFAMVNDRTKNAWTLQLTGGSPAPNFSASVSPAALTIAQGGQGTTVISTTVSNGFNNAIALSAAGVPAGTTVSFTPATIGAPGNGSASMLVNVGASTAVGTYPIAVSAFGGGDTQNLTITLSVTPGNQPGFTLSSSPASLTIVQGNQGTSTVTTAISGGFNSSITLSASGLPAGMTASFNPATIPAPGVGNSQMTITAGGNSPTGSYPITVTGNGGGIQQSATVVVTVISMGSFAVSASPASLTVAQGNLGTSAVTTTVSGGFSNPVSLSASGMPAGATVSFNPQTIPAPGSGNSTLTITVGATTPPGTYPITVTGTGGGIQQTTTVTLTVTIGGQPNFTISAAPASLTIAQGNQAGSTITTAVGGGFSSSITLSASGMPSGATVNFNPNPIPAPGAGTSTMMVTVGLSTPTGTYPITVTGSGGGIKQTTTVNLTVTAQPTFTITAAPAAVSIAQGNQGASTITTNIVNGFNNSISLSASGMPSGTTVSFNPQTIPAPGVGNSLMTITVGASTPVGTYPITVTGSGGGIQQTVVTLTVTGPSSFTISASPASLSVAQGNQGTSTITAAINGAFNSSISLSASGMPSGTTVNFNPQTIPAPGPGSSTMTITVGASAPVGTYPITVTGSGGGIQQNATVVLTVTAQQQPNFTISAAPASLSISQNGEGVSVISTAISGGFNSSISLSASGMPTGTTVGFSPQTIPAPGSGNSTMTITVGSTTPVGTYPITVTGKGGGIQQNTTVSLTVTPSGGQQSFGFDFRNTKTFVSDPSGSTYVLPTMKYPTTANGVTFGWVKTSLVQGRDRSLKVDPRLAGVNFAANGLPATFNVDLPSAGTYNVSLALGDAGYQACWVQCQIQFLDGNTVVATLSLGSTKLGYFYDAKGNNWSAAAWPGSNVSQQVTLTGTRLTVVIGTKTSSGDSTPIAFLGVAQTSSGANFTMAASPAALSVQQGNQGASSITTVISGGFNSAISLSASGVPSGTTVSFNPSTIPAPGAGSSSMNITVGASTPVGTYPITVTGSGGGIKQTATVTLTVTAQQQPSFTLSASPASLSIQEGNQGNSTITTTISGGFNSSIALSAAGIPSGTTVSFNPQTIPAPGSGNSAMTITVGGSTPVGTYPITVTGSGGGTKQTAVVTLTVTAQQASFTLSTSPASLSIQQGNQGNSTITTTISGGFNSSIALSAGGMPSGTTVSFNPQTIPAPGAGNSAMTITVGGSTPTGTYPITVTGNGGGTQQNATVSLTVTSSGGGGGGGNGIVVYSTSGSPQSNRVVSIGRLFKQGDIPHFAQALVGGTAILTQCDVKNRWADGSLKFAIVSFIVPSVATGGTAVSFQDQGSGHNGGFLAQSDMLSSAYDFDGVIQLTGAASPAISARAVLQAGDFRYWLQGPIVTSVILEDRNNRSFDVNTDGGSGNPLHPIFEASFYPQTQQVEVGFTLENSWASSTAANSARNQTYALTLTTGFNSPATQLTQNSFTQLIFSRWRRSYWIDSTPAPIQIDYNWPYLASTTAYANFNPNYTPDESDLESMYAVYTSDTTGANSGRLTIPGIDNYYGNGGIVDYQENTNGPGYAPWIGPYSQWDVDYLMTGDSRMQKMSTDNADLSGRYPIFFREADHNAGTGHYFDAPGSGSVDPYGHVVSINARQYATLNLANAWNISCNSNGADVIATSLPGDGSGWYSVPGDTSHLPDFAYIPYTLTGKYFYLEQEMLEAGFAAGHGVGCYSAQYGYDRQGHYGMLYSTTRELAWALRTMAYAAFIAPDGAPEGPYFASKVMNNIALVEGEHASPQTVSGADPTWAYNWGMNYFQYSQAANPSPLSFWRMGDCQDGTSTCYVANGQGANNNVNAAIVQSAESGFMSSFIDIVLGLTNQLGIVDTTSILQRNARRYLNILLNPAVNHYLVEQYVYPTTLVGNVCKNPANPGCAWISDWGTFQSGYLALPSGWSDRQVDYGAEAASALSFMTKFTVDGYNGQDAWNFFSTSDATQLGLVYHNEPQWCIQPMP